MKKLIAIMVLSTTLVAGQPAEAKGLFRKVLGAPFWCLGFAVTLVADVTIVPMYEGATQYIYAPSVNKKVW